jgi:molybdopterin synthase sulfur carrier subunit
MPTVKLFANLRKVAGTKETFITGASVGAVVSELVKRYPALAANLLIRSPGDFPGDGQIRPHVIITINGHPTDDVDAPVTEQDIVSIFPPMAGG